MIRRDRNGAQAFKNRCRAAFPRRAGLAAGAFFILFVPTLVQAALGGDVDSVQSDTAALRGTLRLKNTTDTYTVHEIKLPSETLVREYVSPQGRVFAITWQGPWHPNLEQILGKYFPEFQKARSGHRGHSQLTVEQPDLVVQTTGHMRSFFGRAYIPDQVPAGVQAGDLP